MNFGKFSLYFILRNRAEKLVVVVFRSINRMLKASGRLQARLAVFVHILTYVTQHLCWNGCYNLLYCPLQLNSDLMRHTWPKP